MIHLRLRLMLMISPLAAAFGRNKIMIQASRLELRSASLILDHDLVPASCSCRGRIISMSLRRGGESYHKGRKDSHEVRQSQRCKIVSALFHSPFGHFGPMRSSLNMIFSDALNVTFTKKIFHYE